MAPLKVEKMWGETCFLVGQPGPPPSSNDLWTHLLCDECGTVCRSSYTQLQIQVLSSYFLIKQAKNRNKTYKFEPFQMLELLFGYVLFWCSIMYSALFVVNWSTFKSLPPRSLWIWGDLIPVNLPPVTFVRDSGALPRRPVLFPPTADTFPPRQAESGGNNQLSSPDVPSKTSSAVFSSRSLQLEVFTHACRWVLQRFFVTVPLLPQRLIMKQGFSTVWKKV